MLKSAQHAIRSLLEHRSSLTQQDVLNASTRDTTERQNNRSEKDVAEDYTPAIVFDSIKLFHIYYLQKMVFSL